MGDRVDPVTGVEVRVRVTVANHLVGVFPFVLQSFVWLTFLHMLAQLLQVQFLHRPSVHRMQCVHSHH